MRKAKKTSDTMDINSYCDRKMFRLTTFVRNNML